MFCSNTGLPQARICKWYQMVATFWSEAAHFAYLPRFFSMRIRGVGRRCHPIPDQPTITIYHPLIPTDHKFNRPPRYKSTYLSETNCKSTCFFVKSQFLPAKSPFLSPFAGPGAARPKDLAEAQQPRTSRRTGRTQRAECRGTAAATGGELCHGFAIATPARSMPKIPWKIGT